MRGCLDGSASCILVPVRCCTLPSTSSVSGRALAGLSVKNLLLVVLTLGLYRPFAVVNTLRMRLESVSVTVDGSAHAWLAGPASQPGGARGEMAGEFFGIDVGL